MIFKDIVEQDRVKEHLIAAIAHDSVSHAYLFTGEKGIGKYTMAKAFAAALLCPASEAGCGQCTSCRKVFSGNHPDLIEIAPEKAGDSIKIRQVREMIAEVSQLPYADSRRVIIIRNGDQMTTEAQNALLKSLEEPESSNCFIITAENEAGMLQTIRSRCQVIGFEPVSEASVRQVLIERGFSDEALLEAALYDSEGSIGKALDFFENKDLEALKIEALDVFYAILKGNLCKIFDFAEKMGKSKSKSDSHEVLNFLIVWFHDMVMCLNGLAVESSPYPGKQDLFLGVLTPERADQILKALFELMDVLDYNVNLRLQWESTLLKI